MRSSSSGVVTTTGAGRPNPRSANHPAAVMRSRRQIDALGESAPLVVERDGARVRQLAPRARIAVRRSDAPGLLVRLGWTSFYGRARRKLQLTDPIELGHALR